MGQYVVRREGESIKSENLVKHLFRAKYIPLSDGTFRLAMIQESNRAIFLEEGYELIDREEQSNKNNQTEENEPSEAEHKEKDVQRAMRRARIKAFDYIESNSDLDAFATFTYNPKSVNDRTSYDECYDVLKVWLDNRVRRKNLKYVIVPERHKKGGIHFHGILNREALTLEKATNAKTGKTLKHNGRTVYNMTDWNVNGFSTVELIGSENSDRDAVSKYIFKYMSKQQGIIGGRYFLHGGDLKKPVYKYADTLEELMGEEIPTDVIEVEPLENVLYREYRFI